MSGDIHQISEAIGEIRSDTRATKESVERIAAAMEKVETRVTVLEKDSTHSKGFLAGAAAVVTLLGALGGMVLNKIWPVIVLGLILIGCTVSRSPEQPPVVPGPTPADVLRGFALWITGLAGAALAAAAIGAVFIAPARFILGKLAVVAACGLVVGQSLYWLAGHLGLAVGLVALALAVSGLLYAWIHRKAIEAKVGIDLDRDGKVGV